MMLKFCSMFILSSILPLPPAIGLLSLFLCSHPPSSWELTTFTMFTLRWALLLILSIALAMFIHQPKPYKLITLALTTSFLAYLRWNPPLIMKAWLIVVKANSLHILYTPLMIFAFLLIFWFPRTYWEHTNPFHFYLCRGAVLFLTITVYALNPYIGGILVFYLFLQYTYKK